MILRRIFPEEDLGMAGANLTPPRNFFTGDTLPIQTKLLLQCETFYHKLNKIVTRFPIPNPCFILTEEIFVINIRENKIYDSNGILLYI